jgi:predicted RNase H-like HicB family nuclease
MTLTAVYRKVPEGYLAFVEELPGANTQGETLEEASANLKETAAMVLDANREISEQRHREINDFLARKICDDFDSQAFAIASSLKHLLRRHHRDILRLQLQQPLLHRLILFHHRVRLW